jgi:hypothetical protein
MQVPRRGLETVNEGLLREKAVKGWAYIVEGTTD